MLLVVYLQLSLLDHSVVIFCNFSCDSSSIGYNVSWSVCLSATSFMELICCYQCIMVVTVVVVYDIKTFCCHILHFQLQQQLYKSQCQCVTNKFHKSYNTATSLCVLYSMELTLTSVAIVHTKSCHLQLCTQKQAMQNCIQIVNCFSVFNSQ